MTVDYQVRVVGSRGGPGTVDLEVSPVTGPTKRVFIVLDLSDSCPKAIQSLSKLAWLWQSLPPQWLVSFYALSSREVLYPRGESLHARDLETCIRDLDGSPEVEEWIAHQIRRGSFLRYPLTGIYEVWQAERAIHGDPSQEALVFVLTDGDLLDLAPIRLSAGMTVVGVLTPSETGGAPCWADVLPKSRAFPHGATDLLDHVRQLIAPAKQPCEVVPSFTCTLRDGPASTASGRLKSLSFKWDFGKGPLVLSASAAVLEDSSASIECRPKQGASVRLSLEGLAKGGLGSTTAPSIQLPSATLSSGRLVRFDDQPLVNQLLEHLKTQSGNGKGLEEGHAAHLRTLLAGKGVADGTPRPGAGRACDAAIVVAVPEQATTASGPTNQQAASTDGRIVLIAGGLLKAENDQLFIQQAETVPKDPGFTSKQTFRVAYDVESARWHLFRGTERKTLAPKACEAVSDLFIDANGRPCEAFYTGPLAPKNPTGK
jgi:hypothetical protein